MQHSNVRISGVGTYHPQNKLTNEVIFEHFRKVGKDVESLYKHLGREERYYADPGETAITMGTIAAKRALENANLSPDQIQMIVFASDTPEYLIPTNALLISRELETKNAHIVYDLNANCTGMITAIDQVYRYMDHKKLRYALLVSSVHISPWCNEDDELYYGAWGDSGAAVVLERVESDERFGVIDSEFFSDSSYYRMTTMPDSGMTRIHDESLPVAKRKGGWEPVDFDFLPEKWNILIRELAQRNGIELKQIDHIIFSQFSIYAIKEALKNLGLEDDPRLYTFVGNKYGYTGHTSPIFGLSHALQDGKIKDGDNVIFMSAGAGYIISGFLYKFDGALLK
jgi:3-oxoacyl-[acyl-carrier-protein] synthase III